MLTDSQYLAGLDYLYGELGKGIHYKVKIITTRKYHQCFSLYYRYGHNILIGDKAIAETTIDEDEGYKTCYTCIDCCEKAYRELEKVK